MLNESREFAYVLMEAVGRPKHVVEVGAFKSDHITCWPFIFDPKCRIQLIEPNPACVAELRSAYAAFPNIEIHECAVAANDGTSVLLVPQVLKSCLCADASAFTTNTPWSPYRSREAAGKIERLTATKVKALTFGHFDDGSIQGLTIDTEGSEWFVLAHLKSRPAVICVEMEGPDQYRNPFYDQIDAWMKTHGYAQHSVEHVGVVPTDYVYVRERA
jgi:FkbM family methyltransferase